MCCSSLPECLCCREMRRERERERAEKKDRGAERERGREKKKSYFGIYARFIYISCLIIHFSYEHRFSQYCCSLIDYDYCRFLMHSSILIYSIDLSFSFLFTGLQLVFQFDRKSLFLYPVAIFFFFFVLLAPFFCSSSNENIVINQCLIIFILNYDFISVNEMSMYLYENFD